MLIYISSCLWGEKWIFHYSKLQALILRILDTYLYFFSLGIWRREALTVTEFYAHVSSHIDS